MICCDFVMWIIQSNVTVNIYIYPMTLSTDFSNKSIEKMYVMHIVAQITEAGIFGITVDIKTQQYATSVCHR